jgi:hypothetical protein
MHDVSPTIKAQKKYLFEMIIFLTFLRQYDKTTVHDQTIHARIKALCQLQGCLSTQINVPTAWI